MNNTDFISYASIAVIVVSLFFIGTSLTGYATSDTGLVNVTVDASASIIFQTNLLDFGNGSITPGEVAVIASNGTDIYWSGSTSSMTGLILENNGNANVTIDLRSNLNATNFLGGTNPSFKLMVTNNESGSCNTITTFTSFAEINTTDQEACSGTGLGYEPTTDSLRIDAELTMSDNVIGAKTATITATGTAV